MSIACSPPTISFFKAPCPPLVPPCPKLPRPPSLVRAVGRDGDIAELISLKARPPLPRPAPPEAPPPDRSGLTDILEHELAILTAEIHRSWIELADLRRSIRLAEQERAALKGSPEYREDQPTPAYVLDLEKIARRGAREGSRRIIAASGQLRQFMVNTGQLIDVLV